MGAITVIAMLALAVAVKNFIVNRMQERAAVKKALSARLTD